MLAVSRLNYTTGLGIASTVNMETNDKYRRESFDGGTTWGSPFQFRGTDGTNGRPGNDASVTYNNIKAALQKAASTQTSFITADEMGAPNIYGGKIYGSKMYANEFNVYPLNVFDNGIMQSKNF